MAIYTTTQLVYILVIAFTTAVFAFNRRNDDEIEWDNAEKVNATPTTINKYPFMVSIQNQGSHICSGAIIDKRYVITNARCLDLCQERSLVEDVTVVSGIDTFNCSGFVHDVEKIYYHPEYTTKSRYPDGLANNIALIKLRSEIVFSDVRNQILLSESEYQRCDNLVNVGWGRLYKNGPVSNVLKMLKTNKLTNTLCERTYRSYGRDVPVSSTDYCINHGLFKGTCHYDMGSPVICEGPFLSGIVSVGIPCCIYYPIIVTDISLHWDWIQYILSLY